MKNTRKGFTLVELLIVIVVIGILSAMMMLSSTEAVTSAKVSNIVSNLRNLKTAALAYYTDNMDDFSKDPTKAPDMAKVWEYLNNKKTTGETYDIPDSKNYDIKLSTDSDTKNMWFLGYTITGTTKEVSQIKNKLKGRAGSMGLLKDMKKTADNAYTDGGTVYYLVR